MQTDARTGGVPFEEVREQGRWRADSSLSTYLDIAASSQIAVDLRTRGLAGAQAFALQHRRGRRVGARIRRAARDGQCVRPACGVDGSIRI